MRKIKVKLTYAQVNSLIAFLECTYPGKLSRQTHEDKLIEACLAELLHKLRLTQVFVKKDYSLQLPVACALGFLIHARSNRNFISCLDQIAVNSLIGIIDQKTI